jgi:hypothetical protein
MMKRQMRGRANFDLQSSPHDPGKVGQNRQTGRRSPEPFLSVAHTGIPSAAHMLG